MDSTAHRTCLAVVAGEAVQVRVELPQVKAPDLTLRTAREMAFATELGGHSRWAIEKAD